MGVYAYYPSSRLSFLVLLFLPFLFSYTPPFLQALKSAVPSLGECNAGIDNCFLLYDGLPLAVDRQIPIILERASEITRSLYAELMEQSVLVINAAVRMEGAAAAAISLLPITLACIPGITRGAKTVKYLVPESALMGYLLLVLPWLQLPMVFTIVAIFIQLGGHWASMGCGASFICALMVPSWGFSHALGPHASSQAYRKNLRAAVGGTDDVTLGNELLQLLFVGLSVVFLYVHPRLPAVLGFEDLFGNVSVAGLTFVSIVLNFFKGKTFTVVVSADLFVTLMIRLQVMTPPMFLPL